ncbi:MAG TPA: phosphatase [Bacillota bacterium]|nr:phosphatase [Bacillota bacterium]
MRIVADLHTHTVASGHAYGTIWETARRACEMGLEMVAITDHGPAMPGGTHRYYFGNLPILPAVIEGVSILKGVEANILSPEGKLDVPARYLAKLDWVAAGLHSDCIEPGSVEENTTALLATIASGLVDVIVHPGNPRFAIDHNAFVDAAVRAGVAIEINNASLTLPHRRGSDSNCTIIARLAAERGAIISLGSDAHAPWQLGLLDSAISLATAAGVTEDQVLNVSQEKIRIFLSGRRQPRPK